MRLVLIGALSLALGAMLFVSGPAAQGKAATPAAALTLPAAKPEKQVWKAREVIRNGDFRALHTGWRWSASAGAIRQEAAREPKKDDYGADLSSDPNAPSTVGLTQNLYLPDETKSATLSLDWRLFGNGANAGLQGFTISIGGSGAEGLESATAPVKVTAENYPGDQWQKLKHPLTAEELKALNTLQGKHLPMMIVFALSGRDVTAYFDNISLVVDGEFTPPNLPGHLAFIESTDAGYELVVSTPGGGSRETVFRAAGASYTCRGIDWRPDNKALCFASDHEAACSWWDHDFYELTEKGLRRVSNGPSLPEIRALGGLDTGTVKVRVRNLTSQSQVGHVYVRGALEPVGFAVGAKGTASEAQDVLVEDVADLGEGVSQYVCVRVGENTDIAINGVDVVAGKTVNLAGGIDVSASMSRKRPTRPTYTPKGDRIIYEMGKVFPMDAKTGAISNDPLKGTRLSWDPACSPVEEKVLFVRLEHGIGMYDFKSDSFETLLKFENTSSYNSPTWLFDGSGFVYVTSTNDPSGRTNRNIALYGMEAKRSVLLTDVYSEDLSQPTLSPDGMWMAVIRSPHTGRSVEIPGKPELWVFKLGESHIGWRIETKGVPSSPSWSRRP